MKSSILHSLVVIYFVLLSLFLFRGIFDPGIIILEEYFPWLSTKQLYDYSFENWLESTQTPSVRNYSFFFMWARFLPFTGFSFILLTTISGVLLYFSASMVTRSILRNMLSDKYIITISAVLPSTFVLLILLYTKLSHFFSLVIGMSLMSLVLSLFILHLNEKKQFNPMYLLLMLFLLWIMPAPQYMILFYVSTGIIAAILTPIKKNYKNTCLLLVALYLFHALPYGLFTVDPFSSEGSVKELVPSTYDMISNSSIDPLTYTTSSMTSSVSKALTGSYLPLFSSDFVIFSTLLTVFGISCIFYLKNSKIVMTLIILYLVSLFFALGVKPLGLYNVIIGTSDLPLVGNISESILQVLRLPHRWQFVELYVKMVLVSVSASLVLTFLKKKFPISLTTPTTNYLTNRLDYLCNNVITYLGELVNLFRTRTFIVRITVPIVMGVFIIAPLLTNPYNIVFSGDFGKSLVPIDVPNEMEEIKNIVKKENRINHKVISLPIVLMNKVKWDDRRIIIPEGFYNFYFEQPSLRWGSSSTTQENLLYGSYGYSLLLQNKTGIGKYYSLQNIKWIFYHGDILGNFYPKEKEKILSTLLAQNDLNLKYSNGNYYLFENIHSPDETFIESKSLTLLAGSYDTPYVFLSSYDLEPSDTLLVDIIDGKIGWSSFNEYSRSLKENLVILSSANSYDTRDIVLSLLTKEEGSYVLPPKLLLLEKEGWLTSNNFMIWFKSYLTHEKKGIFGHYGATDITFIISSKKYAKVNFPFDVEKEGIYELYLKIAAPKGTRLHVKIDKSQSIIDVPSIIGNYKFIKIYEGELKQGLHEVEITKFDTKPTAINLVYFIDKTLLINYMEEFDSIIQTNHNLMVNDYTDYARYITSLEYPDNLTLIYSYDTIYNKGLVFGLGKESYKPLEAWYSGVGLVINRPLPQDHLQSMTFNYKVQGGFHPYGTLMAVSTGVAYLFSFFLLRNRKSQYTEEKLS